jgi:GH15 family glucan-1,4-alpha-glucosidase
VYGIRLQQRLEEREVNTLRGYRGMGPVRVGNAAYEQVQNDSYGSVINAVTQAFVDHRLTRRGTIETFRRLELVGEQAARRYDQPDAGVWEFRTKRSVHTYSSVMCWVACDRLRRIALRAEQARELFEHLLSMRNRHGLLSEDLDLTTGEQWGNFPQTYSMVGLINSAIRLSKPWEEAF